MPNRILKESICSSESLNQLTNFEEIFFYRLIVNCDDYGRIDARPAILKSWLFPLKTIREKQLLNAITNLEKVGMILYYTVDNRPYLQLTSWNCHQKIRTLRSKYPAPGCADNAIIIGVDDDNEVKTTKKSAINTAVKVNNMSEETNEFDTANKNSASQNPVQSPIVIELMLNNSTMHGISQKEVDELQKLYPNVDIMQELRKMIGWIKGNPKKRKTKAGIDRFINSWLAKEQDSNKPVNTANIDYNYANSFENEV